LFDELKVKGTFFILGEIAEYFPDLVKRIAGQGHHLGIHGYYHHLVFRLSPAQFREYVGRARMLVEDLAGRCADAYRATAFSINETTPWAWETLLDLGFKYDSSVYPFRGRRYGDPAAPRSLYRRTVPDGRWLWEIPLSAVLWLGRRWPVCGGGYLRLLPLWLTQRAVASLNREGIGAVIYLHPYETEVNPQIESLPGLSVQQTLKFHFFNFHQQRRRVQTLPKLRRLLQHYRFGTIEQAVAEHAAAQDAQ
jgi:polysaccharide deacetylase family protein (PEP-CTERM system associated)